MNSPSQIGAPVRSDSRYSQHPERRRSHNHVFRTRIQRLRLAELALSNNGLCDQAAMIRTVIDELVAGHNQPDPIGQAMNSTDGAYRP